ncbi:Complement C1s subcomponent [Collichthys lucidus]|uniref:Complement C1s subcomponent n=1 Tax=Collichthys lucidus TaxID=240159 RepID=A0A4U5U7H0_COLLU|nr:Complement C1s subcomponent [Collichthys lucidus]
MEVMPAGALISDRWILTAGRNLFVRKSREDIKGKGPVIPKVYLGITRRGEADASTEVAVEKIVLHPRFQNQSDWDNDLALIQLKKPVVMSNKVTPIPLPEAGQDLADTVGGSGAITGWGWGFLLTPATSLKYLVLPLANHSEWILSYDKACSGNKYGVYMKISSYLPWIHRVMRGDTEQSSALRIDAMSKMYSWQS